MTLSLSSAAVAMSHRVAARNQGAVCRVEFGRNRPHVARVDFEPGGGPLAVVISLAPAGKENAHLPNFVPKKHDQAPKLAPKTETGPREFFPISKLG